MVLTAIEFLGLAFFLGMITGAVLEQLARPRTKPNTTPTTPEPQPDWKKLSVGQWFFHDSPDCESRYSVQERTEGGCAIVCSTPYVHEGARRQLLEIAHLYNQSRIYPVTAQPAPSAHRQGSISTNIQRDPDGGLSVLSTTGGTHPPGPEVQRKCSFCGSLIQPEEEQLWSEDHLNSTWILRPGSKCLSCGKPTAATLPPINVNESE